MGSGSQEKFADSAPGSRAGRRRGKAPSRARRTQRERVAESDRRMLAAALRLIGERGYSGTSLAAIGEAAGYSRGLVHERFGSKAGLLWALVEQILRVWRRESAALGSTGRRGIDALCDLLDNHRRAIEEDRGIRAFYALLFEALGPVPELQPQFQQLHRQFREEIERILRDGIAAGEIRANIDPAAQAALLVGTQRGIAFQYLLDGESFSIETVYEALKRDLRRSLTP